MRLSTHSLCVANGNRTVVSDVTITAETGTVTALVGLNGSGKSTLLRALAGVRRASRGHVEIDGVRTDALGNRQRARRVALVAQDDPPPDDLLVGEMVALGLTPSLGPWNRGGAQERRAVVAALERVGLSGFADRACTQLSGGEHRRALLARGLVQDTAVLLLDEPTNHLDIAQQHRLLHLVCSLERTVVMAIHDLDLTYRHADQVVVLHDGGVLAAGRPAEVFVRDDVARAFGVHMRHAVDPIGKTTHLVCAPMHPDPFQPSGEQ